MMDDKISKLYNALKEKGYSGLNTEADFRKSMQSEEKRKALHNALERTGFTGLGTVDEFSNSLTPTPKAHPQTTYKEHPELKQQLESAGVNLDPYANNEIKSDKTVLPPVTKTKTAAKTIDYKGKGKEKTLKNVEDGIIDKTNHMPVESENEVLSKYVAQFALTDEGKRLNSVIENQKRNIQDKYLKELQQTDEYKQLKATLKGKELDNAANELFHHTYGDKINEELLPLTRNYQTRMLDRYRDKIEDNIKSIRKGNNVDRIAELEKDIDGQFEQRNRELNAKQEQNVKDNPYLSTLANFKPGGAPSVTQKEHYDPIFNNLNAAKALISDARKMANEAATHSKGGDTFAGGVGRGIRDKFFDMNTWTFGAGEMANNKQLLDVVKKADAGQSLTKDEQALMDAAVTNMATQAYFSSDLGRGYKAGQVTAQSIPFMLEILANPVSMAGKSIGSSVLRYGMKRFGKQAMKSIAGKAMRIGGRFAGDALAGTAVSMTTGLGHGLADAERRQIGNIQFEHQDGKDVYTGRVGQVDAATAYKKAAVSNAIEFWSEMTGPYSKYAAGSMGKKLANTAIGKAVNASQLGKFFKGVKSSEWAKHVARLEERAQYSGPVEEYLEEVTGTIANSLAVGDQSLSDLADVDQQIDTFLGVSVMGGVFSTVKTFGYRTPRYEASKALDKAEKIVSNILGDEWADTQTAIKEMSIEDRKGFLHQVLASDYSGTEKKAIYDYVGGITKFEAIESADEQQANEGINPYDAITVNKVGIYNNLNDKLRKALEFISPEDLDAFDESVLRNDAENAIELMPLDDQQREVLNDYAVARLDFEDYKNGIVTEIEKQKENVRRDVLKATNPDMGGMVVKAKSAFHEEPVNVVGGYLVFKEDGTVDMDNSSEVIYYHDDNGKVKMAKAETFTSIESQENAEELIAAAQAEVEESILSKEEGEIESGIDKTFVLGQEYTTKDGITGTYIRDTPEGNLILNTVRGDIQVNPQDMTPAEATALEEEATPQADASAPVVTESINMSGNTPINENKQPSEQSRVSEHSGPVIDEDGEPLFDKMPVEQSASMLSELDKEDSDLLIENNINALSKVVDKLSKTKPKSTTFNKIKAEREQINANLAEAQQKLEYWNALKEFMSPTIEEQAIDKPTAEDTAKAEHEAIAEVQAINQAKTPVSVETEQKAESDESESITTEENKVDTEVQPIKERKLSTRKKSIRYGARNAALGEHIDLRDYLLRSIATGAIKFKWKTEGTTKGLGQHLGLADSNKERNKRFAMLTKEDDATPEQIAESLFGNVDDYLLNGLTDQDVFNEILDICQSYDTPSSMMEAAEERHRKGTELIEEKQREAYEAEQEVEQEREEVYNSLAEGQYNEYNITIDEVVLKLKELGINEDELNNFSSIFDMISYAEELDKQEILDNHEQESNGTADQGESNEASSQRNTEKEVPKTDGGSQDRGRKEENRVENDLSGEKSVRHQKITEEVSTKVDAEIGELDRQIAEKQKEYEAKKNKFGKALSEESQGEMFPVEKSSDGTLFDVARDVSQKNAKAILSPIQSEIDALKNKRKALQDGKQKRIDDVIKADEAQLTIEAEAEKVNTNPTEAQKDAGNYKKGHVKALGFDITLENPKGSERSGVDEKGNPWSITMNNHYGYFKGTEGKDGDHIDTFIGENLESEKVFVVDQVNKDGSFDEHKVMLGFNSIEEAKAAYLSNYSEGWQGLGNITETTVENFRSWSGTDTQKIKPFAEYKEVKENVPVESGEDTEQPIEVETDATKIQQIKNAIAEGEAILKSGKTTAGTPYSKEALGAIRKQVENDKKRIGIVDHGFESDIDIKTANGAYRAISFDPEKRAERFIRNYASYMNQVWDELTSHAVTDEQKELLKEEFEKFREQSKRKHLDMLAATGRTMSSAITGPARFPTARNQKALDAEYKRSVELSEWKEKAPERIKAKLLNAATPEMKQEAKNKQFQREYDIILKDAKRQILTDGVFDLTTNNLLKQAREREIMGLAKRSPEKAQKLLNEINDYAKEKKGKPVFTDRHGIHKKLEEAKQAKQEDEVKQEEPLSFKVDQRKDTRDNSDIYIATPSYKVDSDTFAYLKEKAKENNGYYSKFTKGFLFKTQEDVYNFTNNLDKLEQIAFREVNEISNVGINEQFNNELQQQIDSTLPKGHIYQLGKPEAVLLSAGIPDYSIELAASTLSMKSSEKYQNSHPFKLNEIEGLPDAIQNPIAVFDSKTRTDSKVILTTLQSNGVNFVAAMQIDYRKQGGKIVVNSIRSIYPKDQILDFINWMNSGLLKWVNKEKASEFISKLPSQFVQKLQTNSNALFSATKIIQNFENPTVKEGEIISSVEELTERLNTKVKIVRDVNDITDDNKANKKRKRNSKGWFDAKTGEIVLVLPNAESLADAKRTILHEVVAHKGLRGLLGEGFETMLDNVWNGLNKEVQEKLLLKYKKNRVAAEEYMASIAEDGCDPSLWDKIKGFIKDAFRKIGLELEMHDSDVKYLLWKSKNRLIKGDNEFDIINKIASDVRVREKMKEEKATTLLDSEGIPNEFMLFRDKEIKETESLLDHIEHDGRTIREIINKKRGLQGLINDPVARRSLGMSIAEGLFDNAIKLKTLQHSIEERKSAALGSRYYLESFQNPYQYITSIPKRNQYMTEVFNEKFMRPIYQSMKSIIEQGSSEKTLYAYLYAESGLERNRVMRMNSMREFIENMEDEIKGELLIELSFAKSLEDIVFTNEDAEKYRTKLIIKDFSGITELMHVLFDDPKKMTEKDVWDWKNEYTEKYEGTRLLWSNINAATKQILKNEYLSGKIDKEMYDNVSSMYEYYLPLRNWEGDHAEDVWEYFSGDKSEGIGQVLKKAKGRSTLAGDPIINIGLMAQQSIHSGNRNVLKQMFLSMARNSHHEALKVSPLWVVRAKDENRKDIWQEVAPEWDENPEKYQENVEEFEQKMAELEKEDNAYKRYSKAKLNLPIKKMQENEHVVIVYEAGRRYVVTVLSDPAIARSINGTSGEAYNVQKKNSLIDDAFQSVLKVNGVVMRTMGKSFTTWNPEFVLRNMQRDIAMATMLSGVKEGSEYTKELTKNMVSPSVHATIMRAVTGRQDISNPLDRMFEEYVSNGGETGYSELFNDKDFKKQIQKELHGKKVDMMAVLNVYLDNVEKLNRWAENISRFATYKTSREMGRDVYRSVYDAKEITVNFNRSGTGAKFGNLLKTIYIFSGAGLQAAYQQGRLLNNPKTRHKSLAMLTMVGLAGFLIPLMNDLLLGGAGDDVEDNYDFKSEYERKTNMMIRMGKGEFTKISIPQEVRPFWNIGETLYQMQKGNVNVLETSKSIALGFVELLPFDPFGSSGLWPTVIQPVQQVTKNENFYGGPIHKEDNMFNEFQPAHTKAFKSTSPIAKSISVWLNQLSGGDDVKQGFIDINPGNIETLFQGYFGGSAKFINDIWKTTYGLKKKAQGDSEYLDTRNIPIVGSFYTDSKNPVSKEVNRLYWDLVEKANEVESWEGNYYKVMKQKPEKMEEYMNKLVEVKQSDEYIIAKVVKQYSDAIQDMTKKAESVDGESKQFILDLIKMQKKAMIEKVKEIQNENKQSDNEKE